MFDSIFATLATAIRGSREIVASARKNARVAASSDQGDRSCDRRTVYEATGAEIPRRACPESHCPVRTS